MKFTRFSQLQRVGEPSFLSHDINQLTIRGAAYPIPVIGHWLEQTLGKTVSVAGYLFIRLRLRRPIVNTTTTRPPFTASVSSASPKMLKLVAFYCFCMNGLDNSRTTTTTATQNHLATGFSDVIIIIIIIKTALCH